MKLPTKRFNTAIPLPSYEEKAAGFDFICRQNKVIKPQEIVAIPSNLALEIPQGYVLLIVPRSSTPDRFGLMMPHSLGVIDPFYNGENNEIMLVFYNFTKKIVKINKGDKIAQGILVKYEKIEFDEKKKLKTSKISQWKLTKKTNNTFKKVESKLNREISELGS